jgi:AcrR family transcriptional regulator
MTSDPTPLPAMRLYDEGPVAFEDLTARARIREAALRHFAEEGYERATIRSIARTAGVSPGLLRHHYGSKDGLRAACDEYVFETLHRVNAQIRDDPAGSAATRQMSKSFGRYIARSLADGSTTAGAIFDEMATITEEWVARADDARSDPPPIDRRIRAALVTAMALGIPLLHDHVSRALGADMFEPAGDRLVALALIDIYSHKLLDEEDAATAEVGFENAGGEHQRL